MTATTFGDLLVSGRDHLDAAAGLPDSALHGESVIAAAPVIGRLVLTLSRYLADISPYSMAEATTSRYLDERLRAAVDAREALLLAAVGVHPRTGGIPDGAAQLPDPLPGHLAAAAASMAAGRDLLHTHFTIGADGRWAARSDWSAVLMSVPVTRALAAEVARWSRQLALLTARLTLACETSTAVPDPVRHGLADASGWLLTATSAITARQDGHPGTAAGRELLHAVPANYAPARQVHQDAETIPRLARGVAVTAARLRVITHATPEHHAAWSPGMTADSWQWTATAAAVAYHVSDIMLRFLADSPGLAAGSPELASQLETAAQTAASACGRWREVAAAWNRLTTDTRGLTAPAVADTGDLVIQLGRIAFTDPQWTPARARRATPRDPADLAPDPAQAAEVVSAIHHAADTLTRAAAADLRAVSTAIGASRVHVLTRTLPDDSNVPYRYGNATRACTAALLDTYRAAASASDAAVISLNALAVTMNTPSQILAVATAATRSVQDATTRPAGRGKRARPKTPSGRRLPAAPAPPGTAEEAVRRLGITDPVLLLRAQAIDKAAVQLIAEAKDSTREPGTPGPVRRSSRPLPPAGTPARVAARNFPVSPAASTAGRRAGGPPRPPQSGAGEQAIRQAPSREYMRNGRLYDR